MGLFSRLRADFNHGGLKVHIQAPGSAQAGQVVPVTLTITTDTTRTINSATLELQAKAHEQGFGMGNAGTSERNTTFQKVAQVQGREAFAINPGEVRTVNLELYIDASTATSPFGQMAGVGGALGGALQAVAAAAQKFENVHYIYQLHASLDVQDVGIGPTDKMPIQILPPTAAAQSSANGTQESQQES